MRVGLRRQPHEPLSAFRYRQALSCWPWTWTSAPFLLVSSYLLRMGHSPLWWGAAFVTCLSCAVLGAAAAAGAGFSLVARWSGLRQHSARRSQWLSFAATTLVLIPAWLGSGYGIFLAITRQHITYGRWDNLVALSVEPHQFLVSLTAHVAILITIPVYWMAQAHQQSRLPEPSERLLP